MSNTATIQPTIFQNHGTEQKTYGVRVYDNYGQCYDNTWVSIPDDDLEILQMVIDNDNETMVAIIDFMLENCSSIMIGSEYYEWEEIKHLFDR